MGKLGYRHDARRGLVNPGMGTSLPREYTVSERKYV
jgi:hypothetical protein